MISKLFITAAALAGALALAGCDGDDARVASENLRRAADNFEVPRRIVFYNGITSDYVLVIEGLCSQEQSDKKLAVICKVGPDTFKKHFLGLSDNVTYFSEQMDPVKASTAHYRVTFKPSTIIPSIDIR
jgi:hypothetical protein